jgi:molybdopterin-guanine dinucleotide biosynthesis protein A
MKTSVGGIVLCGGQSTRMGRPKAELLFGDEPMLARVVRLLAAAVQPIVVVAARDQPLPSLPPEISIARDRRAASGPLEGLAAGLATLGSTADAAYVTGCDVPLLVPAFVQSLIHMLDHFDIVVPADRDFYHPLAAVYRRSVAPHAEALLAEKRLRPAFLFERVATRRVPVEQLRDVDPQLASLTNLNHPHEYMAALAREGLAMPRDFAG